MTDVKEISCDDLMRALTATNDVALIDVRERDEFEAQNIDGARNIPLTELSAALADYPKDAALVFVCASGVRSRQAAGFATIVGYTNAASLTDGMNGWRANQEKLASKT